MAVARGFDSSGEVCVFVCIGLIEFEKEQLHETYTYSALSGLRRNLANDQVSLYTVHSADQLAQVLEYF